MTISYGQQVATSSGLGVFWKLLLLWRGSIYQLVWTNLALYIVLYYSLSLTYRFLLDPDGREKFEQVCLHCQKYADLIPVTFVLGFYVSIVITRWWAQYKVIPWPDSCCLFISTCLLGHDDRGRLMRRTIARYLILALIQALRMTSIQVKKRFPTLTHLCEAGIVTENEQKIIESVDQKCIQHPKYWMSLVWAGAIVTRAKKEGRIKDDFAFQTIITEINNFRSGCGGLLDYDWISIPLVYTQVVTLAVYSFFLSSLMGRQFLDITKGYEGHEVDLYVPIFTFLQFFFYMGWLKVAEVLINPFGEDDDDFEMNWLIDRNLQVAYLIVDEMHAEHPELVKDQYWDEGVPDELPYTVAAEEFRQADPWQGSTAEVEVPEEQSEFVYLDKIEEGSEDDEARTESDQENLKEIKIDHLTKPMVIGNGKLKSVRESVSSNLTSLGQRRNESSTSVMGLIRRVLQGPESGSNINVTGLGSAISINSKTGGGNTSKKSSRVRRKKSKPGCYRSISNASPLSHENLSQGMSRINTQEQAIFKMSDTSSVNSLNSESDFPSRSNSEATALREVRDILANDLDFERRKSNHDLEDERDFKAFKSPRQRKKDRSRKPEANVIKLRRRLEQVQALQSQIIKSIDAEIKETQSKDLELDANCDDVIQLLEQKAAELKKSRSRTSDMMEVDISPHESGALRRSRHPSFTTDMNFSSHVPDKIVRGSVSSPGPGPAPSSPVPKQDHEIGSDAKHKVFPILISTASDGSFANELFEMDSVREADDEEENDGSNEESEPQSVVENLLVPTTELIDANMSKKDENYYEESWDNLGTIEEQPELGYQSDSSDTELLATFDKDKKKTKNKSPDKSEPALPTVQEENQDLG